MGKSTGFLEYERVEEVASHPLERIKNFNEFHTPLSTEERQRQAARCMDCGVPFCQSGMTIKGMTSGCPLNNLIPEWNDLVYQGNLDIAYKRLHKTSNFPEFTCRVCPGLCEKACTCSLNGEAVTTKANEMAIIEYAYEHGLADAKPPKQRTGKRVAVVGSGPSGLAVADQLNRRGHSVTVYERNDKVGGLLRYGIPNMKLEKQIIDRKIHVMEQEGVSFIVNANIGDNVKASELTSKYDAVVLCCGSSNPRDIDAIGRKEAKGIHFAVDFLASTTKCLWNNNMQLVDGQYISAKDKDVVIIGGGDTGNDCVGTAIRHGCKSVTQLEMMPKAPDQRADNNPWPQWPLVCKTDYGQEEAIAKFGHDPRIYTTTVKEFKTDKSGNLKSVVLISLESRVDKKTGRKMMVPVEGTEKEVKCQLCLIAAGFLGAEKYVVDAFKVGVDGRTNVASVGKDSFATNVDKVFTAGDMHTGQSLVVKAIRSGRDCARQVDEYLMGYTNL